MDGAQRAKADGIVAKLYQLTEKEVREIADALMCSAGADYLAKQEIEQKGNPTPEEKEAWSALVRSVNRKENLAKRLRESDEGFGPDVEEERVIHLPMEGPDATLRLAVDQERIGGARREWLWFKFVIPASLTNSHDEEQFVRLGAEEARQLRNHLNDLLLHE